MKGTFLLVAGSITLWMKNAFLSLYRTGRIPCITSPVVFTKAIHLYYPFRISLLYTYFDFSCKEFEETTNRVKNEKFFWTNIRIINSLQ